jgi:hypothetical protein
MYGPCSRMQFQFVCWMWDESVAKLCWVVLCCWFVPVNVLTYVYIVCICVVRGQQPELLSCFLLWVMWQNSTLFFILVPSNWCSYTRFCKSVSYLSLKRIIKLSCLQSCQVGACQKWLLYFASNIWYDEYPYVLHTLVPDVTVVTLCLTLALKYPRFPWSTYICILLEWTMTMPWKQL